MWQERLEENKRKREKERVDFDVQNFQDYLSLKIDVWHKQFRLDFILNNHPFISIKTAAKSSSLLSFIESVCPLVCTSHLPWQRNTL